MIQETLDYFEEYRQKKKEVEDYRKQREDLVKEQRKLDLKISDLDKEITSMQGIITTMIDKGIDPIAAKLSTDASERKNLWLDSTSLSNNVLPGMLAIATGTGWNLINGGTATGIPTSVSMTTQASTIPGTIYTGGSII